MKNKRISKKSEVRDPASDLRSRFSDRGFTLLEILVAMGLLMVIVLMMATLFHASTTAWTNGLRQSEMSIQARSVISLIQRDVSQAVVDGAVPELSCSFGAASIRVCTPGILSTNRLFTRVEYFYASANNGTIMRRVSTIRSNDTVGNYGDPLGGTATPLIGNVDTFEVLVPGNLGDYTTNLPAWVDVKLTLSQDSGSSSGFKIHSEGRDTSSTDDDIKTWR